MCIIIVIVSLLITILTILKEKYVTYQHRLGLFALKSY